MTEVVVVILALIGATALGVAAVLLAFAIIEDRYRALVDADEAG